MKTMIKFFCLLLCLTILLSVLVSCDMQGEHGIQGEPGENGELGENGRGIEKIELIDGEIIVTYTDGTSENLGPIVSETEGTEGLAYYPLPDGTYAVSAGTTIYLEEIVIPSTYQGKAVTKIMNSAFSGAYNLKSIMIPNSVISIGSSAFSGCSSLTSITIPYSVTSIGWNAFLGCSSLTSIIIPDSVTSISGYAFYGCSSLTSVTISNSVTSIGENTFYNTAYYNNESNWENGVLYIGNHLIDAKTTISGAYTINEKTKTIAGAAFNGCYSLTSITIPDSLMSIGDSAFRECSRLTSITIPDSVTSIGTFSFGNCSSLTSITIPDRVTSIGDYAFEYCRNLTDIYFTGTKEEWNAIGKSSAEIPSSATIHFNYVSSET